MVDQLLSKDVENNEHGDIEKQINTKGQEILKWLLQGWLNRQAANETQESGIGNSTGDRLNHVRTGTTRLLTSLFGDVTVTRKGYSQRELSSVFPMDGALNLPTDTYSDGMRNRLSKEALRGSFDNAIEAINDTTGGSIPKRQSLNIVRDVARDFDSFYKKKRFIEPEKTADLLILTFDGKGIVMRPDSLRECTKKAAQKAKKLNSRLSPGEKKDRKRMAQMAAVYTVQAHIRTGESIMKVSEKENVLPFRTPVRNKRVWASVERSSETVIEETFLEALQRDPEQKRKWVVLIDGLPHQIKLIKKVMKQLGVNAIIVMDFVHVLEYLWKAAWCFFEKGDDAVEPWIAEKAVNILNGHCTQVAKGLRISATKQGIFDRGNIDKCAACLLNNKERLRYGNVLKLGFPIATGVIEGACRHLINDRLDITGARWSLDGAEAVLKLRSLKSSGDFDAYWTHHKEVSKKRNYTFSDMSISS